LNDERDALCAFVLLLEQEQQTLLSTDTEPLLALADKKSRSAENLSALSLQRQQLLPNGVVEIEAWLQINVPQGLSAWQEIRHLAEHAKELNKTNGELIQIKMRYNQQALSVLIGATQHAAGIYGPDGQTNLPSSGRTLGSG
jgi:flagella synthesis protein FlgN